MFWSLQKGSFGHVFLATRANDPTDNQYYAIKILSKELIMGKQNYSFVWVIQYDSLEFEMMTIVNPFYEFWILFWSNLFAYKLEHCSGLFVLNMFGYFVRLDEWTSKVISSSPEQDFTTFWSQNIILLSRS